MNPKEFRAELLKIMPGYAWTVHKPSSESELEATGIVSSGLNRMSTLSVIRTGRDGEKPSYTVKSSGYGFNAKWLGKNSDRTLARALRGLQESYESLAATYQSHAKALEKGRKKIEECAA